MIADRRVLMVAIAFLAQNAAVGMGFGAYGTMVPAIEREFATSRTLAASGLSVMALMIGLCAPLAGSLLARVRIRSVMIAGALLCAGGYVLLALVRDIYSLLAIFALMIGPGACLLGPIPASMLVANWVEEAGCGKALGFVNMPFFVFVFPFVASWLLGLAGVMAVFLLLAAILLALVPLLLMVVDRPGESAAVAVAPVEGLFATSDFFRVPAFWVLAVGSSLIVATGMTMVTHLVSIGLDHGLALTTASLLLSAFGIAGAAGALLFGWLADRAGVRIALAAAALLPVPGLLALAGSGAFIALIAAAALIGLCASAVVGLTGTALSAWLGPRNLGRGMGLIYILQVPCLFGAAPLAGHLFDLTGSYRIALFLNVATLAATGILFLLFRPTQGQSTSGESDERHDQPRMA